MSATITSISSFHFANLGPLPTTWSNPDSCTDTTTSVALAINSQPSVPYFLESCDFENQNTIDCYPSLEAVNDAWEQVTSAVPTDAPIPYFSPGVGCPSGWTTVGVAAKNSDDELSSTGIYAPWESSAADDGSRDGSFLLEPYGNVFMNALEAGETMVACCPSGFSAGNQGPCYKTLEREAYTASEGCQLAYHIPSGEANESDGGGIGHLTESTFTLYGSEVSGLVPVVTGNPTYTTITQSVDDWEDSPYSLTFVAATYFDMITVVYQESDVASASAAATKSDSEDDASETGNGGSDDESDDDSGAVGMKAPGGSLLYAGIASAVAMTIGVALAVPW